MEKLPKDVLILLALDLNLPGIVSLCQTDKIINRDVCENPIFWRNKIMKDFPTANYVSKNTRAVYLKLDKLVRERPELKDILPLIDLDKFKFINHEYHITTISNIFNSLKKNVLDKIVNDYNKHEVYGRNKQITISSPKQIIDFIESSGVYYNEEYENYYSSLIEQLKQYVKNPKITFQVDYLTPQPD